MNRRPRMAMRGMAWVLCLTPLSLNAVAELAGEFELGAGYLSDDAYAYGTDSGVNEQGLRPTLDLSLAVQADPTSGDTGYWQLELQQWLRDSRRLELEAGQQGKQRLRLDYRELPRYFHDDALSPVTGVGSAALSLPPGWQAEDATTTGMTNLEENLTSVNLWQRRRSLTLDYRRHLSAAWMLEADFRRERLEGTRALAGATGATGGNVRALLLPAPLDYETHIGALTLGYTGAGYHWTASYQGSFFSNGNSALQWQTPFAAHPQWAPGAGYPDGQQQMALEPDNQAHQLSSRANITLSPRNRLYLSAALGRQSQDQTFLPYTVNSQLEIEQRLPRESLNARVDTTELSARLTSRPLRRLNLVTRLKYRDRDNNTPIDAYQRVRSDASAQQAYADARINRPYSLTRKQASVQAAYRLNRGQRLEVGYEYEELARDYSEVARTEEQGVKLGLRSTRFEMLALALDYRHLRRNASEYRGNQPLIDTRVPGSVEAEDFENHPLLRKYYLNDRDRDQWRLRADWYPLQRLTLGAALAHNRDDYPSGYFGLNHSEMTSATVDLSYAPGDDWRLSAFVNRDHYRRNQSGRAFRGSVPADALNPERDWRTRARDRLDVVGLSLEREGVQPGLGPWQPEGTLDWSVSLTRSHSSGDIDTQVGADLNAEPLPELNTRLLRLELAARYHVSPRASVRFALERERYRSADFALDEVAPDALANVLLMGQSSPAYNLTWVTLGYRMSF